MLALGAYPEVKLTEARKWINQAPKLPINISTKVIKILEELKP